MGNGAIIGAAAVAGVAAGAASAALARKRRNDAMAPAVTKENKP